MAADKIGKLAADKTDEVVVAGILVEEGAGKTAEGVGTIVVFADMMVVDYYNLAEIVDIAVGNSLVLAASWEFNFQQP